MHLPNYQNTDVREEFQEIEKILASFSHLLSEEDRIHLRKHLIDGFG